YEILFAQDTETGWPEKSRSAVLIGALQIASFLLLRNTGTSFRLTRFLTTAPSIFIGALTTAIGLLLSSYANSVWQLCLGQGVVVGLGAAVSSSAAIDALDATLMYVFVDNRFSASGLFVAATGVGGAVLSMGIHGALVDSSSLALRWLALVVFIGQCLAALPMVFRINSTNSSNSGIFERESSDQDDVLNKMMPKCNNTTSNINNDDNDDNNSKRPTSTPVRQSRLQTWAATARSALGSQGFLMLISVDLLHHMSYPVTLIFLPGYAAQMHSHIVGSPTHLATILWCSVLSALLIPHYHLSPLLHGISRLGLSLSLWCLWLPASGATNSALLYAFCAVHGLFLGSVGVHLMDDLLATGGLIEAWIRAGVCSLGAVVGVLVAGWLFIGVGSAGQYMPAITFAAAASFLAAAVQLIGGWWMQRST
ncbi:hypothetical protein GGF37_005578, partial [Kickxella alabastrina]